MSQPTPVAFAKPAAKALLRTVERLWHPPNRQQWLWCEELRTGTGYRQNLGYLDAWAMHLYPSQGNRRIAYEVKISRSDFTRELRKPHKRRVGLMVSNLFYFVAPPGVLNPEDIPTECGLLEVDTRPQDLEQLRRAGGFTADEQGRLATLLPAPWRDTSPPPWCFLAAVARNQRNGGAK